MFGSIAIPIWNRKTGGIETIDEPGRYVFKIIVSVTDKLIGLTARIPLTDWRLTVVDIKPWSGGSKLYVDIDNVQAGVTQAKLSPLQIDALLGIGLFVAFALLVESISKVSPLLTVAVYAVIIIALIYGYARFVHPWIKGRKKSK